jgi:hypothetical protein
MFGLLVLSDVLGYMLGYSGTRKQPIRLQPMCD